MNINGNSSLQESAYCQLINVYPKADISEIPKCVCTVL